MKIFELYTQEMSRTDFDLQDDLIVFMHNDPEFYRKELHPFLHKLELHLDAGGDVVPSNFIPIAKKAFMHYQNTFPVSGLEDTLDKLDLKEICIKLQAESLKNYKEEKAKTDDDTTQP